MDMKRYRRVSMQTVALLYPKYEIPQTNIKQRSIRNELW